MHAHDPHSTASSAHTLPATLSLGAVWLTVTDLERSLVFYRDALGLQVQRREAASAVMGVGAEPLVALVENPRASGPAGRHYAGLYHFALLYPSREELARAALRLTAAHIAIEGASDHGVSEALYLSDPDGNGIELYADRPRAQWPAPADSSQRVGMYLHALDLRGLLDLVPGEVAPRHAGAGLRVGHVHLHVGNLERGLQFYRDLVGFELMALLPNAAFVSAGGYHHHLGFNTWRGEGVSPAPAEAVGLHHWTVLLESEDELTAIRECLQRAGSEIGAGSEIARHPSGFTARDPWNIAVEFIVSAP
jgi:catechol 2,3-dioxygenase